MRDATCSVCGKSGERVRYRTYAHMGPIGEWTGPGAHAFVPADVDERVDERIRDRKWFARTHKAEVRQDLEHESEMRDVG